MTTELFSEPAKRMSEVEAKAFLDYVREQQDELPRRTIDAYQRRAWLALGYESWAAMCDGEGLRLPREVTSELEAGGLSLRAISAATGVSHMQASRDLAGVTPDQGNVTPDNQRVSDSNGRQGLDGKIYPQRPASVPPPDGQDDADAILADIDKRTAPPRPEPVMLTLRTHKGEEVEYPQPRTAATFNASEGSGISWAAWSWNPVTGCLHGCEYCYARAIANRWTDAYPVGFTPLFHHERLDAPANTRIPAAHADEEAWKRVFVCSMADLYGRWVPDEWIDQVHASMLATPDWQYILLTKFPARYVGLDMPPGAWVGTSVDEQKRVRIAEDAFRQIDGGAVKWLSLEPLREPLEFTDLSVFDWVVIGAQTETRQPDGVVEAFAPPFEWVARLVAQAREAGCRVHLKPNLVNGRPGMTLPDEYPGNI